MVGMSKSPVRLFSTKKPVGVIRRTTLRGGHCLTQFVIPAIWVPRRVGNRGAGTARFGTLLESFYFERYVLDVCVATLERGGVTSKIDTYQFLSAVEAWGVPKYPDRTVILVPGTSLLQEVGAFIQANEAWLKEPDCWLGTWIDPDTSNCYLDITTIYTCLEDATHAAFLLRQSAQRKIVALYDFKNEQTIYLPGDEREY
jgi:hypothetical protein